MLPRAAAQARGRISLWPSVFPLRQPDGGARTCVFRQRHHGLTGQRRRERIRWALDGFDLERYADMASGDLRWAINSV